MDRRWLAAVGAGMVAYGVWRQYQDRRRASGNSGLTQAGFRDRVDEDSYDSFPASDPPSFQPVTGPKLGIDQHR